MIRYRMPSVAWSALIVGWASTALAQEPDAAAKAADPEESVPSPTAGAGRESDRQEEPEARSETAASAPPRETASPDLAPGELNSDTRGELLRAYQRALQTAKLGGGASLTQQRLAEHIAAAEHKLADGRRDEAIGDLVYLVESSRFDPFSKMPEGRNAIFLLGDALGRAGAYEPGRGYLLRLLDGSSSDTWYRRAVKSLVDIGLDSDHPEVFLGDLKNVPATAPEELKGDIAYFAGRTHHNAGRPGAAIAEFAKVTPRSRFWAQATYLSGLIEVERGQLRRGEQLFCKVAAPKQTPRRALVFGGSDFFHVRDMARLALGRVAHEQYRFDDSRYYYYLVPNDSQRLPEALYESATGRYEAKDYQAARDLIDELQLLERSHAYEDEVWIFDAYVDLALCKFSEADLKLKGFLQRYEPVRNAARRLYKDPAALAKFVETVRKGADPASSGVGLESRVARALGVLLRIDSAYGQTSRRLAQLEHQLSGLRRSMAELDDARQTLASSKEIQPRATGPLAGGAAAQQRAVEEQLGELRRLVRDAEQSGKAPARLTALQQELTALEKRAGAIRGRSSVSQEQGAAAGQDLAALVQRDRERATALYTAGEKTQAQLVHSQQALARDALRRLDARLSRLLRRARLGRIETVLGRKRALEVEIEALAQGLLPRGAVDSLEAARYLRDDEEYWPYDGEDWEDEYVGGEGLR